jgi:hypothetical protein
LEINKYVYGVYENKEGREKAEKRKAMTTCKKQIIRE